MAPILVDDYQPLTEEEIDAFLDELDHNKDGAISYAEVEAKLDTVHREIAPEPQQHNLHHDSKEDGLRHDFLRSIIGSDSQTLTRLDFAARVREWNIPSTKQDTEEKNYMKKMSTLRRIRSYWAVRGPTIIFITFVIATVLAFGVWQLVKYVTQTEYRAALGWGVVLAKTSAGCLYMILFYLLLSMSRYFSTFLRRSYRISRFINWDLSQTFHIYMSIAALCFATLHAIGHLTGSFIWGGNNYRPAELDTLFGSGHPLRSYQDYTRSLPGVTGLTSLGLFYIIALLSMPKVRRFNYELFQLGHLLMFPFIGLLMAHGTRGLLQWPMLGYFLAFPTLLILLERLTRLFMGTRRLPAKIRILDSETVEIKTTIPHTRLWKYQAGQYVFLQVPSLSFWQWHPFTVSVCLGKDLQLHIKTDGNWTRRLRDLAESSSDIQIGIDGPYGAPAQRFYDFSHTVLVGAGIGVTPFSGILADLQARDDKTHGGPGLELDSVPTAVPERRPSNLQRVSSRLSSRRHQNRSTGFANDYRRVDFHWMVRDRNHLTWFSNLLNSISRSQIWHHEHDKADCHLDIRIQTHVTQKRKNIATHVYRWLLEMHRTDAHPESPLTGLINPTHYGRPDFVKILDAHYDDMLRYRAATGWDNDNDGENDRFKVGVFFCGTPVIGEILADRCRLLTARGRAEGTNVEYYFMLEVFA